MMPRERLQRFVPSKTIAPRKYDPNEILTLRLGDLLDRLPAELLAPKDHDASQPVVFEISKLAKQIIEGRPTIELVEIYRQVPGVFASEVKTSDNIQIRFPWPKVVEMLRSAHGNMSEPGLTRAAALHLARLLRGFRGGGSERQVGRAAAGAAAIARAPQWFIRNIDQGDGSAEGERILEELATTLEQFAPSESSQSKGADEHIETSEEFALTVEENVRLRKEIDDRDREIESLRKTLSELESAAIDQIAALNQQCEEYESATKTKTPAPATELALNPQQTAMIESLSHQVTELYAELDRAREDALQATAAHAKFREQSEATEASAGSMQQYLASVAYELERANALLKEMEAKAHQTEKLLVAKDAEIQRLAQELTALRGHCADLAAERDALRGNLYASSATGTRS